MNKNQSNIVLGTATPDIDLAPTSSEQTLNFFAWMDKIDQATPVTPGAVTANEPTCWIINKYYFGGAIAAFHKIFIRYGHREYLSTLFCILPGRGDALRIGGRIQSECLINQCATALIFHY